MSHQKNKFGTDRPVGPTHRIESLTAALSFRISRLSAINERLGAHHFRNEMGVTLSEWRVLALAAEGDPATTIAVRETLLLDRGLLSRIVKGLSDRGLLVSEASPTDKRQTQLLLTADGWELHERCIAFTNERNTYMASVLNPYERTEFERMLDLLIKHNTKLLRLRNLSND